MFFPSSNITYDDIISVENLLQAWKEFLRGKRTRPDVQVFQYDLMDAILSLHNDLKNKTYQHSSYEAFNISDPKPRNIHKARVRDRVLHHAMYRKLYPFFDRTFIADSYSCRVGKGTHRALRRFFSFGNKMGQNQTKTVWVLKGDIRKCFASIDHKVLESILERYITDSDVRWLCGSVIRSFSGTERGKGLPLGNLTSQLFVNVYLNVFDQFMKHKLKATHYIRYADDFVVLSRDRNWLLSLIPRIQTFLWNQLRLELHPTKVSIGTLASGVDFLGWVHFPYHRVLRTVTKKRMMRRLKECSPERQEASRQSYLGLLSHGNAHRLGQQVRLL